MKLRMFLLSCHLLAFLSFIFAESPNSIGEEIKIKNGKFKLASSYNDLKEQIKDVVYFKNNNAVVDFEVTKINWTVKEDKYAAEIIYKDAKGNVSNVFFTNIDPHGKTQNNAMRLCWRAWCKTGGCCQVIMCDLGAGGMACNCHHTDCTFGDGCAMQVETVPCKEDPTPTATN